MSHYTSMVWFWPLAYGSADGGTIAVTGVVVPGVELVADKGGALPADVLDLGQLGIGDDPAGRVPRVRGQNDTSATSNLLGNLVRVDVIAVLLGQGDWNSGEL